MSSIIVLPVHVLFLAARTNLDVLDDIKQGIGVIESIDFAKETPILLLDE